MGQKWKYTNGRNILKYMAPISIITFSVSTAAEFNFTMKCPNAFLKQDDTYHLKV